MRLGFLLSIFVVAVAIASWSAIHRHRQTQWLRAYREASDSLERKHYRDAEGQIQMILQQQDSLTGRESALTLNLLALVYRAEGRKTEAEPLFEKSLKILMREGQSARFDLANVCNAEGRMYLEEGRWQEADQKLQQALGTYQKESQSAGAELGSALHNLGLVRIAQGRQTEAHSILEQAIQVYTRTLGPDDLNLAQVYLDLAVEYRFEHRRRDAQDVDQKALAIQERVFGKESAVARETRARLMLQEAGADSATGINKVSGITPPSRQRK